MRNLLLRLGRRLKGDSFSIDQSISSLDLLEFMTPRAISAIRGLFVRIHLNSASGWLIFLGRGVRLKSKRLITLKNGVTLGERVLIQGLSTHGVKLGTGVTIGDYSQILATSVIRNVGGGCSIGTGSGIGQYSFIGCGGWVEIGENVIMGQYVSFHTERHISSEVGVPIREQGVERSPIVVGDDCWVGAKVTFLPGARVGRGAIIAAGAVVRGEVPEFSIIGGVPAKVIRSRFQPQPS